MGAITPAFLYEQINLADQLLAGRKTMLDPQDLPGSYGRVVKAVDHLLQVTGTQAVLGGGWAVWRHGFAGRLTQAIDIVLPADRIDEFVRAASVSGFEVLSQSEGRWPKVRHKDTDTKVYILPEGGRQGTAAHPAPTIIRHPTALGAAGTALRYITLPALIELKIAAGRARDEADIIELIRVNTDQVDAIRQHLAGIHGDYVQAFDRLASRAREQEDQ
jgi:hypothetical protein